MSTRRYEVSFRAELDDRQVDELADTLFELGFDDICFRPLTTPVSSAVPERAAKGAETVGSGPPLAPVHHSRADSTADRDALRAALQHETARELKW